MKNKLELRMYGFVNYQLTGIQMGIQFSHAVVEYGQMARKESPKVEWKEGSDGTKYKHISFEGHDMEETYNDWANNWKTYIILNGGTTNNNPEKLGTLNQTYNTLLENGIKCTSFSEPDLGDQMTAIVFIVDERVFNRKKYLDFGDWVMDNHYSYLADNLFTSQKIERLRKQGYFETGTKEEQKLYKDWVSLVGGEKNVFLRDYLKNAKLA